MAEIPDSELVRRLRVSDMDALCSLYLRYASRVRFIAYRLLGSREEAEDITHDIFLKIWKARESLPEIDSFPSYMTRMAYNAVLNHIKKRRAHRGYVEFSMKFTPAYEDERVTADDLAAVIDGALETLPSNQKAAFEMSRYDNKTYGEISSELGISKKTVQYHISRVLERLRKLLK